MNKIIFLIFITLLLCGCLAKFKDISSQQEYAQIIGVEYETTKDLLIFGYTLKLEKNKKLDGYAIYKAPGIGGPEILSKEILPAGTVFTIIKVQQCSNCFPFPAYIQFLIKFRDSKKYNNYKVSFGENIFSIKDEVWKLAKTHNRVAGGFSPPAPTTPCMRVRTGRFITSERGQVCR